MKVPEALPVVLIVDDVATNIKILADALRNDYRIKVAGNGADALDAACSDPQPDLILLDVMMPEMDGYEVCQRLRSLPRTARIPIIFVTARNAVGDEEHGFGLGAVDYITKPFSLSVIKARVRTHIQLKQQADWLENISLLDGLTRIANRRRFDEALLQEWQRCLHEGGALSLLMIDIDHFKDYNDRFGHAAGDDCLCLVAETLAAASGSGNLVARYGGEEFVAILPQTTAADARAVGERLRQEILALNLPMTAKPGGEVLSISVGCATARPLEIGGDPLQIVQQADGMLYQAKENGRNQVAAAEPLVVT